MPFQLLESFAALVMSIAYIIAAMTFPIALVRCFKLYCGAFGTKWQHGKQDAP